MNGKRTCVILGAGASRCYRRGHGEMPLQSDIADKLFMGISRTGNLFVGAFSVSSGLRHSERLTAFLRARFQLSEPSDDSRLRAWKELQARGYTLETLYRELQHESIGETAWVIEEFEAIVRTVVTEAVNRSLNGVCEYHRALIRELEPGDFILNFNWDTVASDALYHSSRLWFPVTGFGLRVGILSKYPADAVNGQSYLSLLHVHGTTCLYTLISETGEEKQRAVYLPPETYDSGSSMFQRLRLPEYDNPTGGALRDASPEEKARFHAGWICMPSGEWLKPLFVPPSTNKSHYRHWYHAGVIRTLHRSLPDTQAFVLAGYSIPPADLAYLGSMFVPDVIDANATVTIVNRENESHNFRRRVDEMFPTLARKDYSLPDFAGFCEQFMSEGEKQAACPSVSKSDRASEASEHASEKLCDAAGAVGVGSATGEGCPRTGVP